MRADLIANLRRHFDETSGLALADVFVPAVDARLRTAFAKARGWALRGPANRRRYEALTSPRVGTAMTELLALLHSPEFVAFVSALTGLTVAHVLPGEVRRWTPGCYTLVHDNEHQHASQGLDVLYGVQGELCEGVFTGQTRRTSGRTKTAAL